MIIGYSWPALRSCRNGAATKRTTVVPLVQLIGLIIGLSFLSQTIAVASARVWLSGPSNDDTRINAGPLPPADPARLEEFERFKKSPLYLDPFDPNIKFLPLAQLELMRTITAEDIALFKQIAEEAVETRHKFAASSRLMVKYATKLLNSFIRHRNQEVKLKEKIEQSPAFFTMVADLIKSTIDLSGQLKKKNDYKKNNIDTERFKVRVNNAFDYFKRIVDASPVGAYHRWDLLVLFKDDPKKSRPMLDEVSDLYAQFRAMGYESTTFVAKRIVNLLRLFGRGKVPRSATEV